MRLLPFAAATLDSDAGQDKTRSRDARRDWEGLMQPTREAARRLVKAGRIVVMQNGRVVDAERAKGALRLRLR